jgi:hypothetical protein
MDAISATHDGNIQMIDSTSVRAHQQAATAKGGQIIVSVDHAAGQDRRMTGRSPTHCLTRAPSCWRTMHLAQVRQNQADRLLAVLLFRRPPRCAAAPRRIDAGRIRKSSSFFPDLSSAVSQRGCFPRPAQVSAGRAGFLYFGKTCGYGRRAWLTFLMLAAVFWPSSRNFCSSAACSEDILRASTETTSS